MTNKRLIKNIAEAWDELLEDERQKIKIVQWDLYTSLVELSNRVLDEKI